MQIEIRSIIPTHRSQALRSTVEKCGGGWVSDAVRPERLKEILHAQTLQTIVLITAENDVAAICALLNSVVDSVACALPAYFIVMGVGDGVSHAMQLYGCGADEVLEKTLVNPLLDRRLKPIARRLRRTEEIQRIRLRLQEAQELGNIGSWSYNVATREVWWSPQIYRILNVDPAGGELDFSTFIELVHGEERQMVHDTMMGALENQSEFGVEFRIPLDDGKTRRLYCTGRPGFGEDGEFIEFGGVVQNIEERWQAESKLRRQEEILGYISEYLPAALYQVHQRGRNQLWVDFFTLGSLKGFEKATGYVGAQITDVPYHIIEEDRRRLFKSASRAWNLLQKWVDEFRVVDDNGEIRWIAGQSTPEKCADGSTIWRGVLIDITERKMLSEQVQQADRLSTIGTMAAGIAHEVNNPLVYLLGNVQFVLESLESEVFDGDTIEAADIVSIVGTEIQEMRRALTAAHSGAQRISVIVEDLMTFGRSSPVTDEPVDLRKICRSAARMLDSQIRHRATLFCEFEDIPEFDSNGGQLRQVLVNLLLNAAQAMPDDSVDKNKIYLRIAERDGYVLIEVEDNGPGILERDKRRLFEPFFTTKSRSDGTGLGLYVCRNIIQSMGGKIEVESTLGEGSIFRVILAIK